MADVTRTSLKTAAARVAGSDAERAVVKKVAMYSTRSDGLDAFYGLSKNHDVTMTFSGAMEANGDVNVELRARNDSDAARHVRVNMYATAKYYTGIPGDSLGDKKAELDLKPGGGEW